MLEFPPRGDDLETGVDNDGQAASGPYSCDAFFLLAGVFESPFTCQ